MPDGEGAMTVRILVWKPPAEIVARVVTAGILLGLYLLLAVEGMR